MRTIRALLAITLMVSAFPLPAPASELEPRWRATVDPAEANSVAYGRDGKTLLVSGVRGEVALWTIGDSKPLLRYSGAAPPLRAARFADAGRTVAALGLQDRKIWRWETATAAALPAIDLNAVIRADEYARRFDVDASGVTGLVVTHLMLHLVPMNGRDAPRRIAVPEATLPLVTGALSPDGRSACIVDMNNRIHCHRTDDGTLITSLTYELDEHRAQTIAILSDGALMAGTGQGYIARWKSTTGEYIDTAGFDVPSPANAVAMFPGKVFYAAGRADGQINVFSPDLKNNAPRIELLGAKGIVTMMSINAEGQLAATVGREIVVWDIGAELVRRGGRF